MTTDMNETKLTTLEQVRAFLAGTSGVGFAVPSMGADERCQHIAQALSGFGYLALTSRLLKNRAKYVNTVYTVKLVV